MGTGIDKIWSVIESFREKTTASGVLQARREAQIPEWLHTIIEEQLRRNFYDQPAVQEALPEIETAVRLARYPHCRRSKILQIYQDNLK